MNQLTNPLPNGGIEYKHEDFAFVQSANLESFKAVFAAFGITPPDGLILWGCIVAIAGSNYTVSEGSIFLAGEIYHVPAHSFTLPGGQTPYWGIQITPQSSRQIADGSGTVNVRQERIIQLASEVSPTPGSRLLVGSELRYTELVAELKRIGDAWTEVTGLAVSFSDAGTTFTSTNVRVSWKQIGKQIYYRLRASGTIGGPATSGNVMTITLPFNTFGGPIDTTVEQVNFSAATAAFSGSNVAISMPLSFPTSGSISFYLTGVLEAV